jgi:hypothetical protein
MIQAGTRTDEFPDERAIARKYGVRELVWPDVEQTKVLTRFLRSAIDTGRCAAVPKTAVMVMLDFLQGTLNRQNITKAPHMTPGEFDALTAPYYIATRIVTKIAREKQDEAVLKGRIYQTTNITLNKFIHTLRDLLDPLAMRARAKAIPDEEREVMEILLNFAQVFPEQRRKGRAM